MALQLNPTVADPFPTYPLYQLRRQIFDSLGFIYSPVPGNPTVEVPWFVRANSFAQMGPLPATDGAAVLNTPNSLVYEIKQRLGLPNAIAIRTDNLGTLLTQLCNFLGLGAMIKFLPGNVVPMLTNFINQAEQDLWRDIELDSGGTGTGATLVSPPSRMGTGAITATTGTFTIAAVGNTQVVVVTSATGITQNITNTGISVTDGISSISGIVTNVAGSNVTVQTTRIDAGAIGATMAVNAMVAYGTLCTLDSTALMQRAIALGKEYYGQEDAQLYLEQSKKYVGDYARRSPPNITSIIQLALIDAQRKILRRPELGGISITGIGANYTDVGTFASSFNNQGSGFPVQGQAAYTLNVTQFLDPPDVTSIDKEPVMLLALATVKDMLKQPDGKQAMDEFESYMKSMLQRLPPDAVPFVNNALRRAQETLYRMYKVFRMERWWTWTEVAGQTFYSIYGDDNAVFSPPTGLTATLGTFGNFGQLNIGRTNFSMVTLSDGRVLCAGGLSSTNAGLSSCEIYDPTTGLFTVSGPLNVTRCNGATCLLNNGKVLICGGSGSLNGSTLSSSEVYDPVANAWTTVGSMSIPRTQHTVDALATGNAIVVGGETPETTTFPTSIEVFNPSTNAWTLSAAVLPAGIVLHDAIVLSNGQLLIAGGENAAVTPQSNVFIYSPSSDTIAATGGMTQPRYQFMLSTLSDGTILAVGSSDASPTSAETYSPVGGTWTATAGNTTSAIRNSRPYVMPDGTVYVWGTGVQNKYDPVARTFTLATAPAHFGSASRTAQLLNGQILQAGFSSAPQTYAALYTNGTGWVQTGSLTIGTLFFTVAAVDAAGTTLAAHEVSIGSVTAGFAINLSCNPVIGATGYNWYGRTTGTEQLIGTSTLPSFVDFNTNIPNGALPTAATAIPVYTLDPREVSAVYASSNGVNWRPLGEGIEPYMYNATQSGPPQRYMIRQALEIWPPPADATWQIQVRGYFQCLPFSADVDINSIDPQAIYLKAKIDAEIHFKRGDPKATGSELEEYIGQLIAGSHNTRRYVPGGAYLWRDAVRPVLIP